MRTDIIYNEDCLEGLRKLPDGCIDLCVTDPPYKLGFRGAGGLMKDKAVWKSEMQNCGFVDGFNTEILKEIARICRQMNAYFFCSRLQLPMYMDFIRRGGVLVGLAYLAENQSSARHKQPLSHRQRVYRVHKRKEVVVQSTEL